eukprot:6159207-Prymnesium_polylepis.1
MGLYFLPPITVRAHTATAIAIATATATATVMRAQRMGTVGAGVRAAQAHPCQNIRGDECLSRWRLLHWPACARMSSTMRGH